MGRQSVWTDDNIRALTENFVLAADEVWRLQGGYDFRKYQAAGGADPECVCFQEMASQGHYGPGGGTKQGIYVCTPAGKFLGSINSSSPEAVQQMLKRSLQAWQELPPADRQAKPDSSQPDHRWEWSAPRNGLILKETIRYLSNDSLANQKPDSRYNFDFAWFSAEEATRLLPESPVIGKKHEVPAEFYRRLARCHLLNTAHGEGGTYHADQVRGKLWVSVLDKNQQQIRIRIWGSGESTGSPTKRFGLAPAPKIVTELLGYGDFDRKTGQFSRFELVALGQLYNTPQPSATEPAARTIGWYFTLADPDRPFDRLAPTHLHAYDAKWVQKPELGLHGYQPNRSDQKNMRDLK